MRMAAISRANQLNWCQERYKMLRRFSITRPQRTHALNGYPISLRVSSRHLAWNCSLQFTGLLSKSGPKPLTSWRNAPMLGTRESSSSPDGNSALPLMYSPRSTGSITFDKDNLEQCRSDAYRQHFASRTFYLSDKPLFFLFTSAS